MNKYLRFADAQKSRVYRELVSCATQRLEDHGVFNKDEVLGHTGLMEISDSIRWDYIRKMIEDEFDTELIPLALSYFKRHSKKNEVKEPAKYIATGHGKRTVGFANGTQEHGHFLVHRMKLKENVAKGVEASAAKTRNRAEGQGIPLPSREEPLRIVAGKESISDSGQ